MKLRISIITTVALLAGLFSISGAQAGVKYCGDGRIAPAYGSCPDSRGGNNDFYGAIGGPNGKSSSSKTNTYGGFGTSAPSQSQMYNCAKTSYSMQKCATGR